MAIAHPTRDDPQLFDEVLRDLLHCVEDLQVVEGGLELTENLFKQCVALVGTHPPQYSRSWVLSFALTPMSCNAHFLG